MAHRSLEFKNENMKRISSSYKALSNEVMMARADGEYPP